MKRRILPRAARDLASVERHISKDNRDAAAAVARRLRKSFDLITDRPELGRPTDLPEIREWSAPSLPGVFPYRVRGDVIEILRVFQTSQKRPSKWIG